MHINVYYGALKELLGINFKNLIYINQKGNVDIYRDKLNVKRVEDRIYNFLVCNPQKIDWLITESKKAETKIRDIINREKKSGEGNFSNFIKNFNLYSKIFVRFTTVPFYLGTIIESRLNFNAPRFKKIIKKLEKLRTVDYYDDFNYCVLGKYLRKLAKENKLPYELIWQLTLPEILKLAHKKLTLSKKELIQRKKYFVYTFFNDRKNLVSGKSFAIRVNKILCTKINLRKQRIIKGRTAQPGSTTGIVKIVHSIADIKKIRPGNILVSISTNPDLMPALRIANAIITDEGGIISHAAIISRELNKPCIIGTKIATKVLKDGDLVKVDANKGIVKILKK